MPKSAGRMKLLAKDPKFLELTTLTPETSNPATTDTQIYRAIQADKPSTLQTEALFPGRRVLGFRFKGLGFADLGLAV